MLPGRELELCRASHHGAHDLVGLGARDAVLDSGVGQGLDRHGYERRGAARRGAAHPEQVARKLHHGAQALEQCEHGGTLVVGEGRGRLGSDNALAHGDRRVRHRRDVVRVREGGLPLGAIPAPGNREHDLAGELLLNGAEHRLDHVGLDRGHDHVGRIYDLGRARAGVHAARLAAREERVVVAGAGIEVLRREPRGDPAVGHGARHVAEPHKTDLHLRCVHLALLVSLNRKPHGAAFGSRPAGSLPDRASPLSNLGLA